ncbi:S-layer homology domain-containing protein [Paenibacillus sp. JDR-2]|uniref:S-layer homology domain-containing protein n=1 Tax=Paenibacillus sp. (strain JDR-2) TaxID=324057 RepID=UPI00059F361F|nr:S-layer homology domain-containing protein [Paenibacillus sp. JDR-2]
MKKKLLAGLLFICFLVLPFNALAFAADSSTVQFSKQAIEVDKNASSFTVDLVLNSQTPFGSAEFGIKTDSHVQLKSVTYSQAIGSASQVSIKEKNGISYFGFFDTSNHFSGSFTACTLTFTYTDSAAAVVTLAETTLTRLTGTGGATSESLTPNQTLQITRSASNTPGGGTTDPGNGGNTGTGNTGGSDNVYTQVIDNTKALEALEHAAPNSQNVKTISFEVKSTDVGGAKEIAFQLPYSLFNADEKRQVEINTPFGTVTIPDHVIPAGQLGSAQSLTLRIKQVDPASLPASAQQQVGSRPVLELHFELDGKAIEWKNEQAPVQVVLPYTLSATEKVNADLIVAAYIDSNGKLQIVPTGRFHAEDGEMSFSTTHFSLYTIVNSSKAFKDTTSSWARQDIEALAIRGIINGTTADTFSPNANITRADFTKLLVGVLAKHAESTGAGFKDVTSKAYYYDAVMTAQALGLASGSGDGKFNPGASISRQDMMVLLDRAFTAAGHPLKETASLPGYKDAAKVAAYAKPSVEKLIASGIINGSNGYLTPQNNLTRAEAAKVLHLLYNELY